MARNAPLLPRPRRGAHRRETAAPSTLAGDDLATVHGWLSRLVPDPAATELLLAEVLRRSRSTGPACLATASETTRLQFLTVSVVLRWRGVL